MAPSAHECKPAALAALQAAVEVFRHPDSQAQQADLQVCPIPCLTVAQLPQ